jgi:hypothetical protein
MYNHIWLPGEEGWSCPMCHNHIEYQFHINPDIKIVSQNLRFDLSSVQMLIKDQQGQNWTFSPSNYPEWGECIEAQKFHDFLLICRNTLPYGMGSTTDWHQFEQAVPGILKASLEIDDLLPNGLQSMVKKIQLIKKQPNK